jgi:hypothetical protein
VAISQHGTPFLITSHPQDVLVVNFYIPHNRRTPLQAEEALGPISIPRDDISAKPEVMNGKQTIFAENENKHIQY